MSRPQMSRFEALAILGLADGAEREVVTAAYKALSKKHHPDTSGSDGTRMVAVNRAYDTLMAAPADERRRMYEEAPPPRRPPPPPPPPPPPDPPRPRAPAYRRMPFGKYKGYWLHQLPTAYLEWLDGVADGWLEEAVEYELGRQQAERIYVERWELADRDAPIPPPPRPRS